MDILVLGGTAFLGRHLVDAATARGHVVTVFNRGHHGPPRRGVEWLRGDRTTSDLASLAGRRWHAVVDTSGYVPARVRSAAASLASCVDHYTFVSTLSVYASSNQGEIDETGALEEVPTDEIAALEAIVPEGPIVGASYRHRYGGLKALCERAAADAMPGRCFIVRPGLIVGPHDYTDRFTYWPSRIARGGEVLAPGSPGASQRFIDARDLSEWIIASIEVERTGVYNATGPDYDLTMKQVLNACCAVAGSDAHLTWIDDDFLLAHGAKPWTNVPLWVPGFPAPAALRATYRRALDAGLSYRPLADTIRDTLAWEQSRPPDRERCADLSPAQERNILAAWHARAAVPA